MICLNKYHSLRCAFFVALLFIPCSAIAELLLVAGANSSTTALSKNQVRNLYLGKIASFSDGRSAALLDLPESSPLRNEFYSIVANMSATQAKARWAQLYFTGRGSPPRVGMDADDIKRIVNSNPKAIGYIESTSLDDSVKVLFVVK